MRLRKILLFSFLLFSLLCFYLIYHQNDIFVKYKLSKKDIAGFNAQILNDDMTDYEKIKAIHDYIVANTDYDIDNYNAGKVPDSDYTAYGALVNHKAVCRGYAEAFNALAKDAGFTTKIITGYADNDTHAWNIVMLDGEYYQIDCTYDDPVYDNSYQSDREVVRYDYFLITTQQISLDHSTDEFMESCISDKYMYQQKIDNIDYKILSSVSSLPNAISENASNNIYEATYYFPENINLDSDLIATNISKSLSHINGDFTTYYYTPVKQCGKYYYTTISLE